MALTPTTWNPADKGATVSLSDGNLTAACTSTSSVRSVYGASSGKYYWELTYPFGVSQVTVGVATSLANVNSFAGTDAYAWTVQSDAGHIYHNNSSIGLLPSTPAVTLSVLLDATAKTLVFWTDGSDTGITIDLEGSQFFAIAGYTGTVTANFGQSPFNHTPPSGYAAGLGEDTGVYVQVGGASVASSGVPVLSQQIDRVREVPGVQCLSAGEPTLRLGYPATVAAPSTAVLSGGVPAAFPYIILTAEVEGVSLLQAGEPFALLPPTIADNRVAQASGAKQTTAGSPALYASSAAQVLGGAVFSAGAPSLGTVLRPSGMAVVSAGEASAVSRLGPSGPSVLSAGAPTVSVSLSIQGVLAVRAGAPTVAGAAAVIAPNGHALFSAGVPSTHTALCPWGKTHTRSGAPVISREATC